MASTRTKRRLFVPEVIQTSQMDCGPAALKAMLGGFDVHVSYGRLREACRTEVDGTSVNAIEEMAGQLGLDAEQIIVPSDHLILPEAKLLPCLAVVRLEGGGNHFVVVWRRHGPLLQVMDPGRGRRWISATGFLKDLYKHRQQVPAEAWEEWARGEGLACGPLPARIRRLGLDPKPLLERALAKPGWKALAALDAAVHLAQTLQQKSLVALAESPELIPAEFWRAVDAGDGELIFHGAVLLRCRGVRPVDPSSMPEALQAAFTEKPLKPAAFVLGLAFQDGWGLPFAAVAAALLAAGVVLVEALLLRSLLNLTPHLPRVGDRAAAVAVLCGFLFAAMLVEWAMEEFSRALGRRVEQRLRMLFYYKLPRLGDRYFQSRLISDMAQRVHFSNMLRLLPPLAISSLRVLASLLATVAGIVWLFPGSAVPAIACALVAVGIPALGQTVLRERDQRFREHGGSLTRFYLDALLGIVPVRTHGAAPAMRYAQAQQLANWARAGLRTQNAAVVIASLQFALIQGLCALLVWRAMSRSLDANPAALPLLIYWAVTIPDYGRSISMFFSQWPPLRSLLLRMLEPIGAPEEAIHGMADGVSKQGSGASVSMHAVHVLAGGHPVLQEIDLEIAAGEHVAIVGVSGAGKSTLVGLLLGWYRPSSGTLRIDGEASSDEAILRLRRNTAWVDPQVQLWNASMIDNLRYGLEDAEPIEAGRVIEQSNLARVIQNLPDGLQSLLGEGGANLSGGEGQRVRLARANGKPGVRLAILDEAARGLDRGTRAELLSRARDIWREATMLCITHDVSTTRTFSRVLVLDAGRIVEDGNPEELLARECSRYRQLLEREELVHRSLWQATLWRRLFMTEGRLKDSEVSLEEVRSRRVTAAGEEQ
jgi:ABC-type bacteriocin/lantibiotic exporter with double-glycine peptidase domain